MNIYTSRTLFCNKGEAVHNTGKVYIVLTYPNKLQPHKRKILTINGVTQEVREESVWREREKAMVVDMSFGMPWPLLHTDLI